MKVLCLKFFSHLISLSCLEVAASHCPNSSSTTVILSEDGGEVNGKDGGGVNVKDSGEVNAKGDCENIVLEDSEDEEAEKETEIAKVVEERLPMKKNSKPKRSAACEAWVVGEGNKRSSGDSEKRIRKKPLKYVESSDSENDFDGTINSDETDEEFEEEKKRKKTKPSKAPLKKPNKTQATENSAASIKRGNNPPSEVVKQSRVLEKNSISSGGQNKADPASPLRPLGIHNPSSPSRPSALSSPAATTPTSSLNLKDLLKLKSGGIGSTPSTPNQHRGSPAPAWKPPAKV